MDKAWLVAADLGVDPALVTGHPGVDSRKIGFSTTDSKANDTGLDPHSVLFADHWSSGVSLELRQSIRATREGKQYFCHDQIKFEISSLKSTSRD